MKPILTIFWIIFLCSISQAQSWYLNDNCQNALPVSEGEEVSTTLGFAGLDQTPCNDDAPLVRGIWYIYEGKDQVVDIDILPTHSSEIFLLVLTGECDSLVCVSDGNLRFFGHDGIFYYILVAKDGYQFGTQQVSFSLNEKGKAPYDFCSGAYEMLCDSTYEIFPGLLTKDVISNSCLPDQSLGWLKMSGDGMDKTLTFSAGFFNEITFFIFENNCDSLACIYSGTYPGITLSTLPGRDYYIGVTHENLRLTIPIQVRMSCRENTLHNICSNAVDLECSDSVFDTLSDTIPPDLVNMSIGSYSGLWYKIRGNEQKHIFTLQSQAIENLVISFFTVTNNDCYREMTEVFFDPFPLSENEYVINALPGQDIYVKVAFFNQPTSFLLSHDCETADDNFDCLIARQIQCSDTLDVYETAAGDFTQPKDPLAGNWFILAGSDTKYRLSTLSGSGSLDLTIYRKSCDSLERVKTFQHFFAQGTRIFLDLPQGEDYYIQAHYVNYSFQRIELILDCQNPVTNIYCDNALNVECGQTYNIPTFGPGFSLDSDACSQREGYWYTFEGNDSLMEVVVNFPFQQYSLYEGSCGVLNCMYANETFTGFRRFRVLTQTGKTYYIKMFGGTQGFPQPSFQVECREPGQNLNCFSADTMVCGSEVLLEFNAQSNENSGFCDSGNGIWYTIEGQGELWTFETHEVVDIHAYTGSCDTLSCLYFTSGRLHFFAEEGTTYSLKFDSKFSDAQNLDVQCYNLPFNDCSSPYSMTCGDTLDINFGLAPTQNNDGSRNGNLFGLWYSFEGNGQTLVLKNVNANDNVELHYRILDSVCTEIMLEGHIQLGNEALVFPTDSGVRYTVLLSSSSFLETLISVECVETPDGIVCEKATPVTCGLPFNYSSEYLYSQPDQGIYNQAWYSFEGNGDIVKVYLSDPFQQAGYEYKLYSSDSGCDSLVLESQQNGTFGPFYWNAESGKTYYLTINLTNPNLTAHNWVFEITCSTDDSSPSCDDGTVLGCSQEYIASTLGDDAGTFGECSIAAPGAWFKISGDDMIYVLRITNFYEYFEKINIYIGEGNCDGFICLKAEQVDRLNPSMSFNTEPGKEYVVKIEGEAGSEIPLFDLLVLCENKAENDNCTDALVLECGSTFSGNLANLPLDSDNNCGDIEQGLYYTFAGTGEEFELSTLTGLSEEIFVRIIQNGCDTNAVCLFETTMSQTRNKVVFETVDSVVYHIKISPGLNENTSFSLQLNCFEKPENVDCETAQILTCSDTVDISLATPLGFEGITPCHFTENARVQWYLLPRTNQLLELEILEGKSSSHYVSLVVGVCGNLICENFFDINSENILISTNEDFFYYLAIHGDALSSNDFSFVLNCVDQIENDQCFNPTIIECGDTLSADLRFADYSPYIQDGCDINSWKDVWYEFEGTGDIFEFKFANFNAFGGFINVFLKEDCNALNCITNGVWRNNSQEEVFKILTRQGQEYLISVQHPTGAAVEFLLDCVPQASNDICENAIEWTFGDTTKVNLTGSTGDPGISCYEGQRNGVWYTFVGNGGYVTFQSGDVDAPVVNYVLVEGSCDDLNCSGQGSFIPHYTLEILTEKARRYYILFYGSGGLVVSDTGGLLSNWNCELADKLNCEDVVVLQSRLSIPDPGNSTCASSDENTAWYTLEGDGQIRSFSFNTSGVEGSLEILTQCGDTCLYRHDIDSILPHPFRFITIPGTNYIVKLNISRRLTDHLIVMSMKCAEGPSNFTSDNAILLECGSYRLNLSNPVLNLIPECYGPEYVKYWYHFTGSDSIFTLDAFLQNGLSATIVDENCTEHHDFLVDGNEFETVDGVPYFLIFKHLLTDTLENIEFEVYYECIPDNVDDLTGSLFNLKVVPNPLTDYTLLTLHSKDDRMVYLEIRDGLGRLVSKKSHKLFVGKNEILLDQWGDIPSGLFSVSLTSGNYATSIKLVRIQ